MNGTTVSTFSEAAFFMRSARPALLIALFPAAFIGQSLQAQRSPDLAALDRYVAASARDWNVPGLAIAVVRNDSLVFAKGYRTHSLCDWIDDEGDDFRGARNAGR